jgi:hypothetical protein
MVASHCREVESPRHRVDFKQESLRTRLRSCLKHSSRKVAALIPYEVIGFFNLPNPSSRTMSLGFTQLLAEMNTRNLPWGNGRPARKANSFTAIYEPIFWISWGLDVSELYGHQGLLQGEF